jgi:hypothetical protein
MGRTPPFAGGIRRMDPGLFFLDHVKKIT